MSKYYWVLLFLASCNQVRNDSLYSEQQHKLYDEQMIKLNDGQKMFNEHCVSCHHYSKWKEGSVYPAVQDLKEMDSFQKSKTITEFKSDSLHQFARENLTVEEIELLVYYLNVSK